MPCLVHGGTSADRRCLRTHACAALHSASAAIGPRCRRHTVGLQIVALPPAAALWQAALADASGCAGLLRRIPSAEWVQRPLATAALPLDSAAARRRSALLSSLLSE